MALEQNFQEPATRCQSSGEIPFKHNWKSSVSAPSISSETTDECFECNICLDSVHDPVVTLCGHLYCWPCIYKWIHSQRSPLDPTDPPKCPVCKSNISNSSLVPLYGRGNTRPESEPKKPKSEPVIPRRPPALGLNALLSAASNANSQLHQHQYLPQPFGSYAPVAPSLGFGRAVPSSFFSPTVGMFGEMVYARMFGSSENLFPYPNSYQTLEGSSGSSPRVRRQEMEVDKSLNRVSIFLLCCFILCLLLF